MTILITALWSLRSGEGSAQPADARTSWRRVLDSFTARFSSFFRISHDETAGFIGGLFRFNLGVEIGQLIIVAVMLALASLLRAAKVSDRDQQLFVCGGAVFLSLVMALERLPW